MSSSTQLPKPNAISGHDASNDDVHPNALANSRNRGSSLRILIVSPVRLIRDGLQLILEPLHRVAATMTVADCEAALIEKRSFAPTIILLDLSANELLRCVSTLLASPPAVPILGFAARQHEQDILDYAGAGIAGYVERDASTEELFNAIDRTARGELLCSPRAAGVLFRRLADLSSVHSAAENGMTLTARERQIADCIAAGLSNKQIARKLLIGVSTVKNHVHHLLEKLQVAHRGEAALRLQRWNIADRAERPDN